jgi:hypothetical protein
MNRLSIAMAGRLSTQVQSAKTTTSMADEDDFFLKNIKAKGFCHVSLPIKYPTLYVSIE